MFQIKFHKCNFRARNDTDKVFLQNLHNGATVGYNECLGALPEVFPGKTKHRVYDDQRNSLCNYKTVLGKEESFTEVH